MHHVVQDTSNNIQEELNISAHAHHAHSEHREAEAQLRNQAEAAAAKCDALGAEARSLTAAKCTLEAEVSEEGLKWS